MLVQSFDARPIHHADGVFDGTRVTRLRLSRYVNTCLGFREGTFLGSVEVDDPAVVRAAERAATAYLAALTDAPTPSTWNSSSAPPGRPGRTAPSWRSVPGWAARRSPSSGATCTATT